MSEDIDILYLDDSLLIERGKKRLCYTHPHNTKKCLKVERGLKNLNQQDFDAHQKIYTILESYIPKYFGMKQTSRGLALECELIVDDTGQPSKSLYYYYLNDGISSDVLYELDKFFDTILTHDIYLYDLNPKNFLVQDIQGIQKLRFIDLKNLNKSNSILPLEKYRFFARRKLKRRIMRFNEKFITNK